MKKLAYLVVLMATLSLTACDDFLTADNKSNVTDADYFTTASGFQSLVNDAYSQLLGIYDSGDEDNYFIAGTDMYGDGRGNINEALHRWSNITPENGTVKNFYNKSYDAIRSCYAVKYYAASASVSEEVKAKAIDEARFVAAYYYYLLVNNFGGVPLVTEFAASAVSGYPRATAQEVYEHIIGELTEIISNNNLKAQTATAGGGEASIEAAKALLAKTYLSAAWDLNNTAYFAEAAKLADQVIAGRQLKTEFADLWAADRSGDDNEEFIFDIEFTDASHDPDGFNNNYQAYFSNYYGGTEEGMKQGRSAGLPTLRMLKLFTKEDKRYDATFMRELLVKEDFSQVSTTLFKNDKTGAAIGDYFGWYANGNSAMGKIVAVYYPAWWDTLDDIKAWRAQDPENRKNTFIIPQQEKTWVMEPWGVYHDEYDPDKEGTRKFDTTDALAKTWSTQPCRKFDDCTNPNYYSKSFRDVHLITLPEIFFVAAEAYLKAGDNAKALDRLNATRVRAGLAKETSVTIDKILEESAREMFGNGQRRMDLRRTQKLVEYNNLYNEHLKGNAASIIGDKLLWPIPQSAIDANGSMTEEDQNPGY